MTVRRFLPADVADVNRLHRDVWWPERSHEGWRWLENNPARLALDAPAGWVIEGMDGRPGAFLGNFIQRFWAGDRPLFGATGFSVIVPPDHKGRSRELIGAFVRQPGCFARYTLNANARSSPLYKKFDMQAWPARSHAVKLSWIINPAACLYSRGLRALVARGSLAGRTTDAGAHGASRRSGGLAGGGDGPGRPVRHLDLRRLLDSLARSGARRRGS